jgi:hypothetical protein
MRKTLHIAMVLFVLVTLQEASSAAARGPAYTDPANADADFAYQGEYMGEVQAGDNAVTVGVQVVALGKGRFRAVSYVGGLPGEGWMGEATQSVEGALQDGVVIFDGESGRGEIRGGVMSVTAKQHEARGQLRKVQRQSPTLGKKPPAGAVVLFDGSNPDAWEGGRMTDDGLLMEGCRSKAKFGSQSVHIEFRLPYQPEARGQGRGNSGIYLQGRYEVQMLDSFALEGKHNECGGIYEIKDPDVNMCLPPLSWQTYDIDFTAAEFDARGNVVSPPRMTVRHNGVLVHDDVELPGDRSTRAAPVQPGPEPGPVYLQNHGNPVRYRNIWIVPKAS